MVKATHQYDITRPIRDPKKIARLQETWVEKSKSMR